MEISNSEIFILWHDASFYFISTYDLNLNNKYLYSLAKIVRFTGDENSYIAGILSSKLVIRLNEKILQFDPEKKTNIRFNKY